MRRTGSDRRTGHGRRRPTKDRRQEQNDDSFVDQDVNAHAHTFGTAVGGGDSAAGILLEKCFDVNGDYSADRGAECPKLTTLDSQRSEQRE
jgi:hypothetical protein